MITIVFKFVRVAIFPIFKERKKKILGSLFWKHKSKSCLTWEPFVCLRGIPYSPLLPWCPAPFTFCHICWPMEIEKAYFRLLGIAFLSFAPPPPASAPDSFHLTRYSSDKTFQAFFCLPRSPEITFSILWLCNKLLLVLGSNIFILTVTQSGFLDIDFLFPCDFRISQWPFRAIVKVKILIYLLRTRTSYTVYMALFM